MWMHSARFDSLAILLPPFAAVALVGLLQMFWPQSLQQPLTPEIWLLTVVGIDVAHVYSTIFRSYARRSMWQRRPALLVLVPLIGFTLSCLLYRYDATVFWRCLAYLAVFHFVRQPYGLMRYYQRGERCTALDRLAIYTASVYPLLVWHLGSPRVFGWFMEGDLIVHQAPALVPFIHAVAALIAVAYGLQEWRQRLRFNGQKNLIVSGTALAFASGIMIWNSDVAFTLTNVISHGVPYMAMIWLYNGRKALASFAFSPWLFLGGLFLLAYAEEGFWDAWVWKDHAGIFPWFAQSWMPVADQALLWIVPLLALPQLTHYVLDGFIWRLRGTDS